MANTGYLFRLPNNDGLILNSVSGFPDFAIPDDEELLIDLIVEEEVVDTFLVLEHWMQERSYYFESVHKVALESDMIITRSATHKNENIFREYMANPGILYTSVDISYPFDYRYPDGHRPVKPVDPTPPDVCKKVVEDLFTLTEVRWGNERYAPYLEFLIHEDMEWDYDLLLLTGSLLQHSFVFNLEEEQDFYDRSLLEKNTRMILTRDVGELSGAGLLTLGYHPDMVLHDD